jgi:hypothetical protein
VYSISAWVVCVDTGLGEVTGAIVGKGRNASRVTEGSEVGIGFDDTERMKLVSSLKSWDS